MTAPRITLAVLAYNQSAFIDAAVRSAIGQECEPVEILLSDDASADDSFERMSALAQAYQGPHQVVVRRNPRNLGIGAHYNELVRAARGSLVITMAGDDISAPDRVARIASTWDESQGRLDLIASHLHDMTQDGGIAGVLRVDDLSRWHGASDWARQRPYVVGAAHAFTKRLFDTFGPLDDRITYEDQIITFRALMSGGAATIDLPLVNYRRGGVSARAHSPQVRRDRAAMLNARQLVENAQLLQDARTAGVLDIVGETLRQEQRRLHYFEQLLNAPDRGTRWRAFASAHDVPWGWRWRKFWFCIAPR